MQELNKIMTDKMDEFIKSGKMDEIIQKQMEESVKRIFEDTFRSYGTTTKTIQKYIEESIKIDFEKIELAEYNVFLTDMLKVVIHKHMKEAAETKLLKEIEALLAPAPKEITLQEVLEPFLEEWREEANESRYDFDEYAAVEIDRKRPDYPTVKMWKQKKTQSSYSSRENDPDLNLYCHKDGTIRIIFDGKKNFGTTNFNAEGRLFLMYCAGTKIIDIENIEADDLELSLYGD